MKSAVDAFKARKNQQVTKPVWLYSIQYDSVGNNWLRFTDFPTDITFDGETYTKYVIEHDSVQERLDGSARKLGLSIGNADRQIQYYLENYNGFRDAKVEIRLIFYDEVGNPSVVDLNTFFVEDASVNANEARLILSSKFDVFDITLPRRKFYRGYCTHVFKGTGCAYSGVENSCNQTLQRCKELGNVHRFGAFPAIPQKNVYKINVSA